MEKEAGHPLLVGCNLSKQENLKTRLILDGARQIDHCTCFPNLKVYIEVLTEFNHIYCPYGLNTTTLSQGYILGALFWEQGRQAEPTFQG